VTVTEEMVAAYASLTGDHNPLHFDAEFVAKTDFEGLMAQGGLATGLLHALVAEDMPGPGSVFMRQNWRFPRPVYIGETIRAEATVTRVRASRSIAELAVVVTTVAGDVVLEGDGMVYQAAPSD
jgi:acyl dehydratase